MKRLLHASARLRSLSIATRSAITLSIAIGLIFAAAGLASWSDARSRALADATAKLDSYNRDIVGQQEDRFQRLAAAHRHASELLAGELSSIRPGQSAALLDALYPRFGDGTRRSAPALFDGSATPVGYLRGIGGFVGREPGPEEARRLIAATRVIHAIGEGVRPDLKSLSWFTPDNTLVMFAPDRPDKLLYYRSEAPADMDFRAREFVTITRPEQNPARRTRCTSLQPILYDTSGRTWTTGCMTPAYLNGRYVGGWGSSLLLDDLLATSRFEGLPGTDVVLVSREGRLIRHPDNTRQNQAGTERYLDLTKAERPELRALWAFLQRQGERPFLGHVPELDSYVALRRIPTPGWYALTLQHVDVVEAGARRSLYRVLVSAIICLTLQALLLFLILRRRVAAPLHRLIERTGAMTSRYADPEAQTRGQAAQGDEIERLAADFDRMADQVTQAHARLEQRVRERTDQLARANDELRALAEIDPLTGLMNRRRLRTEMETALAGAEQGVALAVLLFDVDHFKRINDTHGHQIGDQVLQAIAGECRPLLRPSDCFARIGGEEFMVVLRDLTLLDAWQVAERVREGLELLPVATDRGDVRFTVSIGLTSYARGDSAEALYRRADEALYDAKRSGRNRTRIVERPPEQSTAAA